MTRVSRITFALALACASPGAAWAAEPGVFSKDGLVRLTIQAPRLFEEISARRAALDRETPIPGATVSYVQDGKKKLEIPVKLTLRGRTSLERCDFPKLLMRFKASDASGSIFAGAKSVALNTHCFDTPSGKAPSLDPEAGLIGDGRSPQREAMAYRLLRTLGIESIRTRRALIVYADARTSARTAPKAALLLENPKRVAERWGKSIGRPARLLDKPELNWRLESLDCSTNPLSRMGAKTIARIHAFNALIGNWDWRLPAFHEHDEIRDAETPPGALLNLEIAQATRDSTPGSPVVRELPIPVDFDRSSWVAGKVTFPYARALDARFPGGPADYQRAFAIAAVLRLRNLLTREDYDAIRAHLRAKRSLIESEIARYEREQEIESLPDREGPGIFRKHLAHFYEALAIDSLPRIGSAGATLYSFVGAPKSKQARESCAKRLSPGLPVVATQSPPLTRPSRMGPLVFVRALDLYMRYRGARIPRTRDGNIGCLSEGGWLTKKQYDLALKNSRFPIATRYGRNGPR